MAITATSITPDNTLEEFRIQFNKLVTDVDGVASGNTFTQSIILKEQLLMSQRQLFLLRTQQQTAQLRYLMQLAQL